MPVTETQDDFRIRSIDSVHINPSIMEGMNLTPSLLGSRVALPLERYAPINLVNPTISGDFKIPSVLTCNPGVWDAAPSPDYLYQWRSNGVELLGETNSTINTYDALAESSIDCVVTATNNQGFLTEVSNNIIVKIVEPILISEQSYLAVSGLPIIGKITSMENRFMVISGIPHIIHQKPINFSMYALSGLGSTQRTDIVGFEIYTVTF